MRYNMTIQTCDLKRTNLQKSITDLNTWLSWIEEGEDITLADMCFNWSDKFISDLLEMSRMGVAGEITTTGEEGEYCKFVVKENIVEEYYGEVHYPDEPNEIHKEEFKEWKDLNSEERAEVYEAFVDTEDRNESDKIRPREEDVADYYNDNAEKFGFAYCEHDWIQDGENDVLVPIKCSKCELLGTTTQWKPTSIVRRDDGGVIEKISQELVDE